MVTIKLDHQLVVSKIEQAKRHLEAFVQVGDNRLNYVDTFKGQELEINELIGAYLEVVMYNLEDTRINVNLIKQQDASITR